MRVMTSSRSSASMLVLVSIFLLLSLQLAQVILQAIEALFPEAAVVFEPVGGIFQRTGFEPAGPPLRLAPPLNKTRVLEHLEMLGDRRKAHGERFGQLDDGSLARNEASQDRAPRRISEGREGGVEAIGRHRRVEPLG